jgi:putative membrane protein
MSRAAWLGVYLRGICMGAADAVPGVSGGTIALITGIYERLIAAITALDPRLLGDALGVHTAEGRERFVAGLVRADVAFLVVLGLGVVTAVVTVSRVMELALHAYRAETFAFFFGLIAASAVVLYGEVSVDTPGRVGAAVLGFAAAFVLAGVTEGSAVPHSPAVIFGAGAVAITAMILPGVSGAFLLLLLGQYDHLVTTLSDFVDRLLAVATGGDPGALVDPAVTVVSFVAGAAVGLLTVAHVIRWALSNYRAATLTFLVSLMVGSLRLPVAEVLENGAPWTPVSVGSVLALALVGAVLVLGLDRYTDDLDY